MSQGPSKDPHSLGAGDTWAPEGTADTDEVRPPTERFVVEGLLGRGGMGEVHRVWDTHLQRYVARKRLRSGRTDLAARFRQEARVTGRLDHPNIVPVHELGRDEEGHWYLTMKEVRGDALSALLKSSDGSLEDLTRFMRILITVCNAVAFAHARGVVHRDLKPQNIMVGEFGEVQVMDWGLAHVDQQPAAPPGQSLSGTEQGLETRVGEVIGSPLYLSPEAARGEHTSMGPHSDVFSLGIMIYVCLCGKSPWDASSSEAIVARARVGTYARPSEVTDRSVPHELEAVALRAMEARPEARYASASDLAADLEAWLDQRPLSIVEYGPAERLLKWGQRNRKLVSGVTGTAAVALALFAGFTVKYVSDMSDRTERAVRAESMANAAADEAQRSLTDQRAAAADAYVAAGRPTEARKLYEVALASLEASERDTLAVRLGMWRADREILSAIGTLGVSPEFLIHLGDDTILVDLGDGELARLSLPTGRALQSWTLPGRFHKALDGGDKVVFERKVDDRVQLWMHDLPADEATLLFDVADGRTNWYVSPEGDWFLVQVDGKKALFNRQTGWDPLPLEESQSMRFLGRGLALGLWAAGPSELVDMDTLKPIRKLADDNVRGVLSPDGRTLALHLERTGLLRMESTQTGEVLWSRERRGVTQLAFTGDGRGLLLTRIAPTMELLDVDTGEQVATLAGHSRAPEAVFVGTDLAVTLGTDLDLKLWALPLAPPRHRPQPLERATTLSPDGRLLVRADDDQITLVDLQTGTELRRWPSFGRIHRVRFTGEDQMMVSSREGSRLYGLIDDTMHAVMPADARVAELLPDGRFAAATVDGAVGIYERDGSVVWEDTEASDRPFWDLLYDPGSEVLYASAFSEGELVAYDARSGETRFRTDVGVRAYNIAKHDHRLSVGSWNSRVTILDESGAIEHQFGPFDGPFLQTAWSPDGRHLAATGFDYNLRFFDTHTGEQVSVDTTHDAPVGGVWWLSGDRIWSSDGDGVLVERDLTAARKRDSTALLATLRDFPESYGAGAGLADRLATHELFRRAAEAAAQGGSGDMEKLARWWWLAGEPERAHAAFVAAAEAEPSTYLSAWLQAFDDPAFSASPPRTVAP